MIIRKKGKKPKILIADDEPHIIQLIKLSLGGRYSYVEAENGEQVLDQLKRSMEYPDLLLLDVMMPRINGFELCEQLKKDKKTKDIPIVLVSAKTQEKDIIQGLKLGADHYITKPFDPMAFEDKIKKIIDSGKKGKKKE